MGSAVDRAWRFVWPSCTQLTFAFIGSLQNLRHCEKFTFIFDGMWSPEQEMVQ